MSEYNLLNYPYNNKKLGTRIINTIVNVNIANQVWEFDINIPHERIYPATAEEGNHIESFTSSLEMEVIKKFEFNTFEEQKTQLKRYMDFYNS